MKIQHKLKGVTLVEMLVYMGILSIFLLVLSQIFVLLLDTMLESESSSSADHDIRYVFEKMGSDIGQADAITIPSTIGSTSSTLQLLINGISYTFSSQSGKLVVTENGDTSSLIGYDSSLHDISFTRVGSQSGEQKVRVHVELKSIIRTGPVDQIRQFTTTFGAR